MIHIITDTTACLYPETAQKLNIPVIPQVINFGNESYLEGVDLDAEGFMRKLKAASELPKTAAPPPELFIKEFERLAPTGETIFCIHPSSDVSGTVRSALTAKAEFPGADIRVIDSRLVASPLGTVVEQAASWVAAGESADSIERRVKEMASRGRIFFLVATLEYLAKGGRIGGAAALLGSMLQIKPILVFKDGRVDQYEKERTHKNALARLKDIVCTQSPHAPGAHVTVLHAGVLEAGQALAKDLQAILGVESIPVHNMPPAIVTHGGPGILGIGFFA